MTSKGWSTAAELNEAFAAFDGAKGYILQFCASKGPILAATFDFGGEGRIWDLSCEGCWYIAGPTEWVDVKVRCRELESGGIEVSDDAIGFKLLCRYARCVANEPTSKD